MKPFQLSEDILPLGEFKTQASRVLRQLRASQRPVVITQNGRPAAVLITPEEFDRIREREHFVSAIREGLADAEAGRVVDDEALGSYFDERFGPPEPE
jgi:prevent-host-death family protein